MTDQRKNLDLKHAYMKLFTFLISDGKKSMDEIMGLMNKLAVEIMEVSDD